MPPASDVPSRSVGPVARTTTPCTGSPPPSLTLMVRVPAAGAAGRGRGAAGAGVVG